MDGLIQIFSTKNHQDWQNYPKQKQNLAESIKQKHTVQTEKTARKKGGETYANPREKLTTEHQNPVTLSTNCNMALCQDSKILKKVAYSSVQYFPKPAVNGASGKKGLLFLCFVFHFFFCLC